MSLFTTLHARKISLDEQVSCWSDSNKLHINARAITAEVFQPKVLTTSAETLALTSNVSVLVCTSNSVSITLPNLADCLGSSITIHYRAIAPTQIIIETAGEEKFENSTSQLVMEFNSTCRFIAMPDCWASV
jgi:hypothetical protein